MNKDIDFPKVKDVSVAVVPIESDKKLHWEVYLINTSNLSIKNVMVTSTGFGKIKDEEQKTSTLRYFFDEVKSNNFVVIELIDPAVFSLNNEYWISYWVNDKLFDKRYLFVPESINEQHFTSIPLLEKQGILHE